MTKPEAIATGIAIFLAVIAVGGLTWGMQDPVQFAVGVALGVWVLAPVLRWVERA